MANRALCAALHALAAQGAEVYVWRAPTRHRHGSTKHFLVGPCISQIDSGVAVPPEWYYLSRMKTLTVKLPDPLFAEISRVAEQRKVPKSEIVRERLEQGASAGISLWQRMEDLVVRDDAAPRDLSSNKNHLAGYGKNRDRR